MNNRDLLLPEIQQFILLHEADDESKMLLKHKSVLGVPTSLVVDQIVGRRKAKLKLPSWYATPAILYPPHLNIEQSSSESTAVYKTKIIKQFCTKFSRAADLTGGFGVDSYFLSSVFKEVNYVEPDSNLFEIVKHNHFALINPEQFVETPKSKSSTRHIHHYNTTAEDFLASTNNHFDLIFIDPSRRTKGNQKIFRFADCKPNLIQLLPKIFKLSDLFLVKASPLIDLQAGINELPFVEKIFVVAVDNECKEVLFLCRKDFNGEPSIGAVNLKKNHDSSSEQIFEFSLSDEKTSNATYSDPLNYLYEPNAAILKSGSFKLVGNRFQLLKLQQHTHLYTSETLVQSFPGRIFKIDALIKPDAKTLLAYFQDGKANVITRNYPLSAEQLKKKIGLKDGGEKFLIGFAGQTQKFTAVCQRVDKLSYYKN